MYNKITSGKQLQIEIERLLAECGELTKPTLSDFSLLPRIKEIVEAHTTTKASRSIYYYVPVVVMLYSPRCFLGHSMQNGLRKAITETLNLSTPSSISHTWTSAQAWLCYNKEFRESVDTLFYAVINELKSSN